MVSQKTADLRVRFDSFGLSYFVVALPSLPSHETTALDEVVINWGRSSLFEAPMNRTCDLSFIRPFSDLPIENYLYSRIRVKLGDTLLFEGSVDRIRRENRRLSPGRWEPVYTVSAIETHTFHPDLLQKRRVRPDSGIQLWTMFNDINYRDREILEFEQGERSPKYAMPDDPVELSLYEAFSAAAAPWPLSFPSWRPGMEKVEPTTWKIPYDIPNNRILRSENCTMGPIEATAENTPMAVEFGSGGRYGRQEDGEKWNRYITRRPGVTGRADEYDSDRVNYHFRKLIQPFAIRTYAPIGGVFDDAWKLIKHQKSNPLDITFFEDGRTDWPDMFFYTWEQKNGKWKITGEIDEPVRYYLETSLRPIGGRLTFTHERTTHKVKAIYA